MAGADLRGDLGLHHRLGEYRDRLTQEVDVTPGRLLAEQLQQVHAFPDHRSPPSCSSDLHEDGAVVFYVHSSPTPRPGTLLGHAKFAAIATPAAASSTSRDTRTSRWARLAARRPPRRGRDGSGRAILGGGAAQVAAPSVRSGRDGPSMTPGKGISRPKHPPISARASAKAGTGPLCGFHGLPIPECVAHRLEHTHARHVEDRPGALVIYAVEEGASVRDCDDQEIFVGVPDSAPLASTNVCGRLQDGRTVYARGLRATGGLRSPWPRASASAPDPGIGTALVATTQGASMRALGSSAHMWSHPVVRPPSRARSRDPA